MRERVTAGAVLLAAILVLVGAQPVDAAACVDCHKKTTPSIVTDWQLSKHSQNDVDCAVCHGDAHTSAADVAKVKIPTPATCEACHEKQVAQFNNGKHALAWLAMKAMPSAHAQPVALMDGYKGCGGCHKIGNKTEAEHAEIRKTSGGFGVAGCDACHTRHTFSKAEAKQPQACQTCHMGFDHPQWEMYSSSKHGVRALLKQTGALPATTAAPTCQDCHMQEGDHGVMTGWGFLAVRLPLPKDKQWAADQVTILQGLGVLDPDGKPTARLDVVKAGKVARLTQEEFQAQREKMLKACNQCHSGNFARLELEKTDNLIKAADRLMADAITTIAGLYKDGILPKPKSYAYAFPDLLTFHDAPTAVEQKLFAMFLEHRMRTFQGAFHNNPDYSLWYGWSEMQRDLTEIKEKAAELRAKHKPAPAAAHVPVAGK